MAKLKRKVNVDSEADDIIFEHEAKLEGGDISSYLSIWYGPPKIGKTTMLSKLDGVYFLPTEPGYKFLKIRKTRIRNWASFKKFVKWAEKHTKEVSTVKMWCIDPVDKLSKFCMTYVCNKRQIEHPQDEEWGKGWEAYRDEFEEWVLRLCAIGPGVAAISHVKERDVVFRGEQLTKETPSMPKTCYTILNDLADIIVYMGYEERKRKGMPLRRCLYTRGSDSFEAGDRTGKLPPAIIFDNEAEAIDIIKNSLSGRKESKPKSKKLIKKKR